MTSTGDTNDKTHEPRATSFFILFWVVFDGLGHDALFFGREDTDFLLSRFVPIIV